MPLAVYIVAVLATVLASAAGITLLAAAAALVASLIFFQTELRQLKLPALEFWRTDP